MRYALTADGVSIAYHSLGSGAAVLQFPTPPFGHLHMQLRDWGTAPAAAPFLQRRRLVRWDSRGTGLSARNPADLSLDAHVLDAEAVVERAGVKRFVALARASAGPIAMTYAARHPDQVSHLVLMES